MLLWDAGIAYVDEPSDVIEKADQRRAREALGIDDPKAQRTVQYWQDRTGLDRAGISQVLEELGVNLSPSARVLPPGALKRLKKRYVWAPHISSDQKDEAATRDPPPLEWKLIGSPRSVRHLSVEEVCRIHDALALDFALSDDPIDPPGVRDKGLLESAVSRPHTSLGESDKYPTVEMAGSALLHSLVLNHPFHNGNKRTGIVSLLVFLDANKFIPTCAQEDLFRLVLRLAQRSLVSVRDASQADREVLALAEWIKQNSRQIAKGERPMPWHRLKRILRSFDCEYDTPHGVGNRINISRSDTVKVRSFPKRIKRVQRTVQVQYAGDGTEVTKDTLNYIRQQLCLDERSGYDSRVFYEADAEPDDFIQQYRTLLRRLARL